MASKALSIRQPWAWLIVNGHKDVENRDWHAGYRGPLLIHAGKSFDMDGYLFVRGAFPEIDMPDPDAFPRGGVVGRAVLTGVVREHPSPWFFGRYGFVLADPEPMPLRPCRGHLGFFDVDGPDAE